MYCLPSFYRNKKKDYELTRNDEKKIFNWSWQLPVLFFKKFTKRKKNTKADNTNSKYNIVKPYFYERKKNHLVIV